MYRKRDHASGRQSPGTHRILIGSFCIKSFFILIELSLGIAFGVTEHKNDSNKSAILEWIIALVFIFCESILSVCLTWWILANIFQMSGLIYWTFYLQSRPRTVANAVSPK